MREGGLQHEHSFIVLLKAVELTLTRIVVHSLDELLPNALYRVKESDLQSCLMLSTVLHKYRDTIT